MENYIVLPPMHDSANLSLADPSLVNFYADIANRVYWLTEEIGECSLDLVQYITRWNREDRGIAPENRQPIRIIIDCGGGSLSVSETLSNVIKMSKTPVIGIALGFVCLRRN